MPRKNRWYLSNTLYEVEHRILQGRALLLPTETCRAIILGVLALATERYPSIKLHAFNFLSNHYHLLLSSTNGARIADFLWYVNRQISIEMGELFDWKGTLWEGRPEVTMILDDVAAQGRLKYILLNGCKEGFVGSPRDWRGASSTPALLGNMCLEGFVVDRRARREAKRRGQKTTTADFRQPVELRLHPLPGWQDLSELALREKHESLVSQVERETAARNKRLGRRPAGMSWVRSFHPHDRIGDLAETPAPPCHTSSSGLRRLFRAARKAYDAAFCLASNALRELLWAKHNEPERAPPPPRFEDIVFPAGCFPPGQPHVPGSSSTLARMLGPG